MKKLVCLALIAVCSKALYAQNSEKWFISSMADKPIGYVNETIKAEADKTITAISMKLVFNRKDSKIEMYFGSETTENSKGELIAATGNTKTTGQDISLKGVLVNDSIEIVMATGGQTYKSKIAVKEKLLGPAGIKKMSMNRLKQAGDSINYTIFSPDLGIIVHVTRSLLSIDKSTVSNNAKTVFKIKESFKENPLAREIWVNENYGLIKMIDPSPFGNIESNISVKQLAQTAGALTILPEESYGNTVIRSNVRFTDPRNLEQVTFKITLKNKSLKFPNLTATHQKIIEQGKDYAIVQYTRPVLPKAVDNSNTQELADYLSPNSLINSDDPGIMKIADEETKNKKTNFEKAIALKNWVSANVKVDIGVVLAPGSEVYKIRKGTCVAFSTFYASLLRAAKVPARYCAGYVYMNGIWGGHAWIEINANGAWIPMDATINTTNIADAARISFGEGWSFKNGAAEFAASEGSVLYGNADIKVLSYVIKGKQITVAETAKIYTIENNTYHNPGKQFRIKKTDEFNFKNLDEVWPSGCFATIAFKDGEVKIIDGYWKAPRTIEEAIKKETESISGSKIKATAPFKGSKIYIMSDKEKAFYIVTRGKELMLFYANGNNPVDKLKTVILNTKFE